jgi:chorismate mutase
MGEKRYNPMREKEVLERVILKNKGPLKEGGLRKIFMAIMEVCRKSQITKPTP